MEMIFCISKLTRLHFKLVCRLSFNQKKSVYRQGKNYLVIMIFYGKQYPIFKKSTSIKAIKPIMILLVCSIIEGIGDENISTILIPIST